MLVRKSIARFRSMWTILWKSGLFFIVWGLFLVLFLVPLSSTLAEWEHTAPLQARLYTDIVGAVTILAATWLSTRFIDRRSLLTVGFAPDHIRRGLLVGLAVGAGWLATSVGIAWAAGWVLVLTPVAVSWSMLLWVAIALLFNVLTLNRPGIPGDSII